MRIEDLMRMKDLLRNKGSKVEHPGHIGLEDIDLPLNEAASVDDRIVLEPDPEQHAAEPAKKKGIVSVNGQDVDSSSDEEKAA